MDFCRGFVRSIFEIFQKYFFVGDFEGKELVGDQENLAPGRFIPVVMISKRVLHRVTVGLRGVVGLRGWTATSSQLVREYQASL